MEWLEQIAKNIFNNILSNIEWFVNKAIALFNKLIAAANKIPWVRIPLIAELDLWRLAKWWIAGEWFWWGSPLQKFANGGVVTWPNGIDAVPAMLTAWEVVLNAAQQRNLATQLSSSKWSYVTIVIENNNFYGDDRDFAEKIGDTIMQNMKNHIYFQSF